MGEAHNLLQSLRDVLGADRLQRGSRAAAGWCLSHLSQVLGMPPALWGGNQASCNIYDSALTIVCAYVCNLYEISHITAAVSFCLVYNLKRITVNGSESAISDMAIQCSHQQLPFPCRPEKEQMQRPRVRPGHEAPSAFGHPCMEEECTAASASFAWQPHPAPERHSRTRLFPANSSLVRTLTLLTSGLFVAPTSNTRRSAEEGSHPSI